MTKNLFDPSDKGEELDDQSQSNRAVLEEGEALMDLIKHTRAQEDSEELQLARKISEGEITVNQARAKLGLPPAPESYQKLIDSLRTPKETRDGRQKHDILLSRVEEQETFLEKGND